jgi:hypothetical protein
MNQMPKGEKVAALSETKPSTQIQLRIDIHDDGTATIRLTDLERDDYWVQTDLSVEQMLEVFQRWSSKLARKGAS